MIPVWLIPPTETPCPDLTLCPSTCLWDQIIQNSLQPYLNTMLSSLSVDIRSVARHRIPSQSECICRPTSSDLLWLTDFSAKSICSPSPKFANHRYSKGVRPKINGYERRPLWFSWALIDSGLRMTRDHTSCHSGQATGDRHPESAKSRHRAMETIVKEI